MMMTPIENIIDMSTFVTKYMTFCENLRIHIRIPLKKSLVDAHKLQLGKQNKVFQGSHKFWIWEYPTWQVLVSNIKGICFEVDDNLTPLQAENAWDEYKSLMGV